MEKLLNEKVQTGTDSLGRPIYRKLSDVINRQLAKKAAEGEQPAIKLLNEYDLKLKALEARSGPYPETLRQEQEERAEAPTDPGTGWRRQPQRRWVRLISGLTPFCGPELIQCRAAV